MVSVWKSPNEIFLCFTLALWFLFFKSPRLKKPTFHLFFLRKTSFYAVCPIKKQNLSMLYAILRNPSFTSALLIPMDLKMRFPARCVMAPNTCSILERVLALVRFPCFSHEVNGCPLHPFLWTMSNNPFSILLSCYWCCNVHPRAFFCQLHLNLSSNK